MLFNIMPSARPDGYGEALLPMAEAKQFLRVDAEEEEVLIEVLRDAAIEGVEQYSEVRMGPCTGIVATFGTFGHGMRMGVGPAATVVITAISYRRNGDMIDLSAGDWRVAPDGDIEPGSGRRWPAGADMVRVTFDAGYPTGTCPHALKMAVRLLLGHLWLNREAIVSGSFNEEMPLGVTWWCDRGGRMPKI